MSRLGGIAAPLALALALAIAAALTLTSCGASDDAQLLPGGTADEITANLDTVEQLAGEGECLGAEDAAEQVSAQVEALQGVDETLVRALDRGAARLNEVVATCEETTTEELAPTTVPERDESTASESEEKEREKEEKEREKEEKETEKEEEKDEESETGPPEEAPPSKGKGDDGEPSEEPSGGIGPGDEVGGGD